MQPCFILSLNIIIMHLFFFFYQNHNYNFLGFSERARITSCFSNPFEGLFLKILNPTKVRKCYNLAIHSTLKLKLNSYHLIFFHTAFLMQWVYVFMYLVSDDMSVVFSPILLKCPTHSTSAHQYWHRLQKNKTIIHDTSLILFPYDIIMRVSSVQVSCTSRWYQDFTWCTHRPITPKNVFQNKYKTINVKLHHVNSFFSSVVQPSPLPNPAPQVKKKNPLAGKWFLSVRYTHTIHIYISHTPKEEDNGSFRSSWHYFTPWLCRHKSKTTWGDAISPLNWKTVWVWRSFCSEWLPVHAFFAFCPPLPFVVSPRACVFVLQQALTVLQPVSIKIRWQ